jgi:predicted nuclease of predicted toxin-antitoxin system
MRVLLDENMPHRFRRLLPDHEVFTVSYLGWRGKKNGELLALMKGEEFRALVTFDKALVEQQDLKDMGIGVVVLSLDPITYPRLRLLAPDVLRALQFLQPGQVVQVSPSTS